MYESHYSLGEVSQPAPQSQQEQIVPQLVDANISARAVISTEPAALNSPISLNPSDWFNKPVVIGSGAYGTAIAHRFAEQGMDVSILGRSTKVIEDIQNGRNDAYLPGKPLKYEINASTSSNVAMLDRGTVVLAVPSMHINSVLNELSLDPDTIIISMAKGLIVEGWDPLTSEHGLKLGPPQGSKISTPLQLIRKHPNCQNVEKTCVVAGPGFASQIIDGTLLDLCLASENQEALDIAGQIFASRNTLIDQSNDPIGVEIVSTMKNVIAIMVGVADKLSEMQGTSTFPPNLREVIKRLGMQETSHLASYMSGQRRTMISPAGYPDLNLTTSSTEGRNYSLGRLLAEGADIDSVVKQSGKVVEGAWSAWAVKRLADDSPGADKDGVYMPVTNALIDIFRGANPAGRVERLIDEVQNRNNSQRSGWKSGHGVY